MNDSDPGRIHACVGRQHAWHTGNQCTLFLLGRVRNWPIAYIRCDATFRPLSEAKRTSQISANAYRRTSGSSARSPPPGSPRDFADFISAETRK